MAQSFTEYHSFLIKKSGQIFNVFIKDKILFCILFENLSLICREVNHNVQWGTSLCLALKAFEQEGIFNYRVIPTMI